MNALTVFANVTGISDSIPYTNPHLMNRIHQTAKNMNGYEIVAHQRKRCPPPPLLQGGLTPRGEPEAIADYKYFYELAAAWSVTATEHQLTSLETILTADGSIH